MAISIKSPAGDVIPAKGAGKGATGTFDGEPGYQKRTPSPNAMPEKTYDAPRHAVPVGIKTPGETSKKL